MISQARLARLESQIDQTFEVVNPDDGSTIALGLADVKPRAKARLAAWRWAREVGGITLANGVQVDTSDSSQRKISELRRRAVAGEMPLPFEFKAVGGVWLSLGLAEIVAVDQAVAAHIRACYALDKAKSAEIDAATDVEQIRAIIQSLDLA